MFLQELRAVGEELRFLHCVGIAKLIYLLFSAVFWVDCQQSYGTLKWKGVTGMSLKSVVQGVDFELWAFAWWFLGAGPARLAGGVWCLTTSTKRAHPTRGVHCSQRAQRSIISNCVLYPPTQLEHFRG